MNSSELNSLRMEIIPAHAGIITPECINLLIEKNITFIFECSFRIIPDNAGFLLKENPLEKSKKNLRFSTEAFSLTVSHE